jgi:hypothetical protein
MHPMHPMLRGIETRPSWHLDTGGARSQILAVAMTYIPET